MIHEEKLNGALNRFSFPRFRSPRPCTTVPYSSAYGIDYLSFPSVYLSIHRSAFMLPHDFFLPFGLSIRLSIYLFISLVYPSICLPSILFSPASFVTNHFIATFSCWRHFYHLILHSGDSSKFSHLSRERNSHKPDKR